jgi:hypothetical protein
MSGEPRKIVSADLKAYLATRKRDTRLLGAVERHILAKPFDYRRKDILHPSEIIKKDWCARAAYFALKGEYVENRDKDGLRMQSIFDEGHYIHAKWQGYFRDMGVLHGSWLCQGCSNRFTATSPEKCPKCFRGDLLEYKELTLYSDAHRMGGHTDGWIIGIEDECLIEVKSIGAGTMRMEDPSLFYNGADLESAWKTIRRPFASHYLQGQVYLHLAHLMVEAGILTSAPNEIVFIYELKANQDYKEFVVQYAPEHIKHIFDLALDVVFAVERNRPPMCSIDFANNCKKCMPYKEGHDADTMEEEGSPKRKED